MADWYFENYFKVGPQGNIGSQGIRGTQGDKGVLGEEGQQGKRGLKGESGKYYDGEGRSLTVSLFLTKDSIVNNISAPTDSTYNFYTDKLILGEKDEDKGWSTEYELEDTIDKYIYSSHAYFEVEAKDGIENKGISPTIAWSTPIIENSQDGEDAEETEYVYLRNNSSNYYSTYGSLPESKNIDYYCPNGYTSSPMGVDEKHIYEWKFKRSKHNEVWSEFSTPILCSAYGLKGADGANLEYIFTFTESAKIVPSNPTPSGTIDDLKKNEEYQYDDYYPEDWQDDASECDSTVCSVEWVSQRRSFSVYNNVTLTYDKYWSSFTDPTIWTTYFDPQNAKVIKLKILGTFSSNPEVKKENGKGYIFINGKWTELKMNDCIIVGGVVWVWNGPDEVPMWDKSTFGDIAPYDNNLYLYVRYAKSLEHVYNANLFDWTDDSGTSTEGAKYMGTAIVAKEECPTDPKSFSWHDFKGKDGRGYEYIYTTTDSIEKRPLVPTESDDEINNPMSNNNWCGLDTNSVNWTDDPVGVNDTTRKYEWICQRESENGVWKPFEGTEDGYAKQYSSYNESYNPNGRSINPGIVYYPAGIWDSSTTYTRTYYSTPYVYYEDEYYYFYNNEEPGDSLENQGTPEESLNLKDGYWKKFESYDAIATQTLVADGSANIANSYFSSNYLFSLDGIDEDGDASGHYEYFFDYDPYYENDTYENYLESDTKPDGYFKPNWCVDLETGKMWCIAGRMRWDDHSGLTMYDYDGDKIFYIDEIGDLYITGGLTKKQYTIDTVKGYNDIFIPLPLTKDEDGSYNTYVIVRGYNGEYSDLFDADTGNTKRSIFDFCNDEEDIKIHDSGTTIYNMYDEGDTITPVCISPVLPMWSNSEMMVSNTNGNYNLVNAVSMSFDCKYLDSIINIKTVFDYKDIDCNPKIYRIYLPFAYLSKTENTEYSICSCLTPTRVKRKIDSEKKLSYFGYDDLINSVGKTIIFKNYTNYTFAFINTYKNHIINVSNGEYHSDIRFNESCNDIRVWCKYYDDMINDTTKEELSNNGLMTTYNSYNMFEADSYNFNFWTKHDFSTSKKEIIDAEQAADINGNNNIEVILLQPFEFVELEVKWGYITTNHQKSNGDDLDKTYSGKGIFFYLKSKGYINYEF